MYFARVCPYRKRRITTRRESPCAHPTPSIHPSRAFVDASSRDATMPSRPRERAGAGEIFDRAPRWMIARAVGAVVVPVSIAMALSVWLVTLLRDDASREVVSGSVVSAVYTETVRRWFRANETTGGTTRTRANEGVDDSRPPGCWRARRSARETTTTTTTTTTTRADGD